MDDIEYTRQELDLVSAAATILERQVLDLTADSLEQLRREVRAGHERLVKTGLALSAERDIAVAERDIAVEALQCLLAGQKGDQLIMNPDEFIKAALRRVGAVRQHSHSPPRPPKGEA